MKVRSKNETVKASRIFTDREEPRAAFWKNYNRCVEEMATGGNIHVLTYYGIGGIGKSSLVKKLMSEMDERLPGKRYVYFDFNIYQESRAVLTALKNKLTEEFKFSFPLFELGSYVYAKKIGDNPDSLEIKQMTEKSPFLSLAMSIVGNIPIMGFATSMLSLADQCVAYVRTYLKNHSRELKQIEYMEAEELYRHLPYLFAKDMAHNQEQSGKLLVVMLDTYERLVNELSSTGDPLRNDLWIRGEEGLIQNIPNVLWVIAGREKLKWERFDPDWAESLEQHILGNLSSADSDSFLSGAGVGGSELRQQLYELTNGTPVYLDLCVDQFTRLSSRGILPDISMFGQNTYDLIERFIRYMSDSQKDLVYTLACLQMWNDKLIMQIAGEVLPGFSLSTYEKAKDFSFVIQSDNSWYNIHQTVGEVLVEHCPQLLKEKICQKIIDHFTGKLETQDICGAEYPGSLGYILRAGLMLYQNREDFRSFYRDSVMRCLDKLIEAGRFQQAEVLMDLLRKRAEREPSDLFYADILCVDSTLLYKKRDYAHSEELAESAVRLYQTLLGKDHGYTLLAANILALTLEAQGQHQRALEILESLLQKFTVTYGADDSNTLAIMGNLGTTYLEVGQCEKAVELKTNVFQEYSMHYGTDHPRTLWAMSSLADTLSTLKRYEEALPLCKEALAKYRVVLGSDHRDTVNAMGIFAGILFYLGRYEDALPLYEEAFEKKRALYGSDYITTVYAGMNVARTLRKMGRHAEALPLYEDALSNCRMILGSDHSDTVTLMEHTANTLYSLGRSEEALPMYEEILSIRRVVLGNDHLDTVTSMNSLACTLYNLSRFEEAAVLFEEALSIRRALLGNAHPDTVNLMFSLAETLYELSRYEEALPLYEEVLSKKRTLLGDDHLDTVIAMRNVASTLYELKRYEQALALEETVFAKRRALLGDDHPDTLNAMKNLQITLTALKQHEKSLELCEELLSRQRRVLGDTHEDTLKTENRLAVALYDLGDYDKAAQITEQLLQTRMRISGEDDLSTILTMNNLASCLFKLGRYKEALPLQQTVLAQRRRLLGEDDPKTVKALKKLIDTLRALGREDEAKELERQLKDA